MKFLIQFFKSHSLNIHIIAIFLSLILVSSASIISFTYVRNYQSILNYSKKTIEEAGDTISEELNNVISEAEIMVKITAGLLYDQNEISLSDPKLISYLSDVISQQTNMMAIYIGLPDGSFIGTGNLHLGKQEYYLSNRNKPLPKEALFVFDTLNHSKSPLLHRWVYTDGAMKPLDEETIATTYDVIHRPWYQGALHSPAVFWTTIYSYYPLDNPGITVSKAIRNPKGEVIGVAGVDLSLYYLEPFLQSQKIGKTGRAVILDQRGNLLIPVDLDREDPKFREAVLACYTKYGQEKEKAFLFASDRVPYLGTITPFPHSFGNDWMILILVPLSELFGELFHTQYEVILISLAILLFSTFLVFYFSSKISHPIVELAKETEKIKVLELDSDLVIRSSIKEIRQMDVSIRSMRAAISSFIRYLPKEVVTQLIQQGKEVVLGGEKKELAIFFSDIAGFSTMAEHHPVEPLLAFLSDYFDGLSKIILTQKGTIDKYTGDGIMAFWGAPTGGSDPENASMAALQCQSFIEKFNEKQRSENKLEFPTRIGLNLGVAIVGNIGTLERINYTAIGGAVTIASRLQVLCKEYHTSILASEKIQERLSQNFITRLIDVIGAQGKGPPLKIYELVGVVKGMEGIVARLEQIDLCRTFDEAISSYQEGDLKKAKTQFEAILVKHPSDYPTQLYLKRLK